MDFASESVRDAFPPPPTRPAHASAAPADDNGRSFDDHLDAANPPPPERTAPPQNETREEPAAPLEARAPNVEDGEGSDEETAAEFALLGGPLPPAPPPMPAPIAVQIAISQPEQAPQTDAQAQADEPPLAPLSAPTPPSMPAKDTEMADAGEPVSASAPSSGRHTNADAKDTAPEAARDDRAPQPQTQARAAPAENDATLTAAQQAAGAPVPTSDVPQAVQQAIAATISPAPQTTTQNASRSTKDTRQAIDAKSSPTARDAKPEAPISHAKAQASAAASAEHGKIAIEALPAPPSQSAAPDASQIAENSAMSATATQASTHVQQASAETGAQRAAPAAAQVGREIIRRFNGGTTNFELRLDPADLGRVEVRMEVTRDHRVTAVITADNPQALTELARGARDLEQQLQSAGLQLTENGLSFDLRQGAQRRGDADDANANTRGNRGDSNTALNEQQAAPVARPIGYERWRGVRVDMMV